MSTKHLGCGLDSKSTLPDTPSYFIVPNLAIPLLGSYEIFDLNSSFCFDRFSRLGPYGLNGGGATDWSTVNISDAQGACYQNNKFRFDRETTQLNYAVKDNDHNLLSRNAFVLRLWEGYEFNNESRALIRSLITELSLFTNGQFDVHILVEVKTREHFWATQEAHDRLLKNVVPEEMSGLTTLWSEALMESFYARPFEPQRLPTEGSVYRAHRSMHFPLQWFAQKHQYDYYWNWEADAVWIGHWFDLVDSSTRWAREQPRSGLSERNERFYIPSYHGTWDDFSKSAEKHYDAGDHTQNAPGVGEEADFLVFNPIFNPEDTDYVWRNDLSGYPLDLQSPQRRSSIITTARLSRRLLNEMHRTCLVDRHTMASEMMPASISQHMGFKSVFAPLPVFFDRDCPGPLAVKMFDNGIQGSSGGHSNSPFSLGREGPLQDGSYYYNAQFGGALWKHWIDRSEQTERSCLPQMLIHPAKRFVQ